MSGAFGVETMVCAMKIVVISPNISENMSGEAIKAYQYVRQLSLADRDFAIIVHARCRGSFEHAVPGAEIHYIEDDILQKLMWASFLLRPFITFPFFLRARGLIRKFAQQESRTIFHYLCPVSPILPRFPVQGVRNVLGPVTGNIYYPPALRNHEPLQLRWRRRVHRFAQSLAGAFFNDKAKFDKILISGGARTSRSLEWAGASEEQFDYVFDSGISHRILQRPAILHRGENNRFVTNGRLVPHKGVDLSIRAIAQSSEPITLDVFGDGPETERLEQLIRQLGVEDRVRLRGWLDSHEDMLDQMMAYRGFIFPSLAEANGIVVQEALAMGLPVVCLDWGGPSVLTTPQSATRIEPRSKDFIVTELRKAMENLATDADEAARQAAAGLNRARACFGWEAVIDQWVGEESARVSAPEEEASSVLKVIGEECAVNG